MNRTTATFAALSVIVVPILGCARQAAPQPNSAPTTAPMPQPTTAIPKTTLVTPAAELPEWSLAGAAAASLGDPYSMTKFEIRPPANFRFIKYSPETKTYIWVGPVRADETYPQLMVIVTPLSAQESNNSLTTSLQGVLGAIQKLRESWTSTPIEQGKINGVPFVRCSWNGVVAGGARAGLVGRKMHGVVYLAVHENSAIQIMCQDVEPDHAEGIKLGGISALSFRVVPSASP